MSRRTVVVTGGSSGIGRAIAVAFAEREGARVIATGLTADDAARLADETPQVEPHQLDVTSAQQITELVSQFDQVDVLVNCAGAILRDGREHEVDGFEQIVDVNLHGTMRMCAACHSRLAATRGCVLNTASMLSFFGSGFAPAYSASKGGVAQLTKSLAIAWARDNVRVNAIAPGWIETNLTKPLVEDADRGGAIADRTPMGRWGQPADVVGPALFLCSAEAGFITGAILPVDGGYSIA